MLLKSAVEVNKVHCDSTYKLIWQGYPVVQIGTTDAQRKFHPFGLAVCTHETTEDYKFVFRSLKMAIFEKFNADLNPNYLIAKAIQNAFRATFEGAAVITCWFHVKKAAFTRPEKLIRDQQKLNSLARDLAALQISQTPEIFELAAQLFIAKWRLESEEFANYFHEEWLTRNKNWYEGFAKRVPSTNNALESHNRTIKDEQTLRQRMEIGVFRVQMYAMIRQWSVEYNSGLNEIIHDKPKIDLSLWTLSYQWASANVAVKKTTADNRNIYRPDGPGQSYYDIQ